MTSLKDVQGQLSCINSFSLFPACNSRHTTAHFCLCFLYKSALSIAPKDTSVCVLNAEKKTTWLFRFYEAEQLKNMYAPWVDVTLHLISISAGELHPTFILTCIIEDHIHYPSECPSVVLSIALIRPHSNLILSHGLFPVATHKPKLFTVCLKEITQGCHHEDVIKAACTRPRCSMPIAYLQCDFTVKDLRTAGECQILLIHNTVDGLLTIISRLLNFWDRQNRSTEVRLRNINNAIQGNINKMLTLYVYVLPAETMHNAYSFAISIVLPKNWRVYFGYLFCEGLWVPAKPSSLRAMQTTQYADCTTSVPK